MSMPSNSHVYCSLTAMMCVDRCPTMYHHDRHLSHVCSTCSSNSWTKDKMNKTRGFNEFTLDIVTRDGRTNLFGYWTNERWQTSLSFDFTGNSTWNRFVFDRIECRWDDVLSIGGKPQSKPSLETSRTVDTCRFGMISSNNGCWISSTIRMCYQQWNREQIWKCSSNTTLSSMMKTKNNNERWPTVCIRLLLTCEMNIDENMKCS
jgi:hypothetical protein